MANMQFTVNDEEHVKYKELPRYERLRITEELRNAWENQLRKLNLIK